MSRLRHPVASETDLTLRHPFPLISVQSGDGRPPLFFFHGDYDDGAYTKRFASALGVNQSFVSIPPHGLVSEPIPDSIEAMALDRLGPILQAQPEGPFRL